MFRPFAVVLPRVALNNAAHIQALAGKARKERDFRYAAQLDEQARRWRKVSYRNNQQEEAIR